MVAEAGRSGRPGPVRGPVRRLFRRRFLRIEASSVSAQPQLGQRLMRTPGCAWNRAALVRNIVGRYSVAAVNRIRQIGVLALLLASCLAPVTACMVPGARMSAEERACCHLMGDQCGQAEMPPSHGCCHKTAPGLHGGAVDTKFVSLHPAAVSVVQWIAFELLNPSFAIGGRVEHADLSLQGSPPSSLPILRI